MKDFPEFSREMFGVSSKTVIDFRYVGQISTWRERMPETAQEIPGDLMSNDAERKNIPGTKSNSTN